MPPVMGAGERLYYGSVFGGALPSGCHRCTDAGTVVLAVMVPQVRTEAASRFEGPAQSGAAPLEITQG